MLGRYTYNPVDEWGHEALCVAVASAVEGASWVQLALGAIGGHLGKVERAVHAAWQLCGVDIECELVPGEVGHLVLLLGRVEKVDARRHNAAVADLLHPETIAIGCHAVLAVVGDTIHDAILGASLDRRAGRSVGLAAPVAAVERVGRLVDGVRKRVEDQVVGLVLAAARLGAPLRDELGVHFGACAGLLGADEAHKEGGQAGERES